jgi:hypothetical protein
LQPKSKWRLAPLVCHRRIKDTSGRVTERPVIVTTIVVGGKSFKAEVCLIDRSAMRHRLILGRAEISGRFLIDASQTFLHPLTNKATQPPPTPKMTVNYHS